MSKASLEEISHLSVAERIQLAEDIWDTIAVSSHEIPLTEAQAQELDNRLADYQQNPQSDTPWETVRRRVVDQA